MIKSALIVGGAGFIGFHLAKHLAEQNYDIVILDNFSRGKEDREFNELIRKDNVKFILGDVTNYKTFENLKQDFDYIYYLAAINGTENFYKRPHEVLKVGILGVINVLEWFVKQKKGKLLFSSSSEAYAGAMNLLGDSFPIPTPEEVPLVVEDPKNVRWSYGGSKIISEVAIHSYAKVFDMKNFTIVRYHNIYGPRMGFEHVIPQFIGRINKLNGSFDIFGGKETRAFCYVSDAVRATQMMMENPLTDGETINIGRDDSEIKISDLAKNLFKIANVNPTINTKPAPEGCVMRRCPDVTKLRKFGFSPVVNLKEGLKLTYDWYKENPKD